MSAGPPLAVTMGDPAGIGLDVALQTYAQTRAPAFFLLADPESVRDRAAQIGLSVTVAAIAAPEEAAAAFAMALPVLPIACPAPVQPGVPDPAQAPAILASIEQGTALALSGRAAGLVTNPIHKQSLYAAGFRFPGHTEYLGALTGTAHPVMMLSIPGLSVVPVTIHMPLAEAIRALSAALIARTARTVAAALAHDFAIARPRLAVAGLNPHAGEGGTIGREEIEIIAPAVARLQAEGLAVSGPHPADSLFHAEARTRFDAALCHFHDQALIPLKTLDFFGGVNVTLGLPIVRTSPDHGTAFDIAGRGIADPRSFAAALEAAARIARNRARAR